MPARRGPPENRCTRNQIGQPLRLFSNHAQGARRLGQLVLARGLAALALGPPGTQVL